MSISESRKLRAKFLDQIKALLIHFVADVKLVDGTTEETKFEDLGFDSLDHVELVMDLEDEFDIQISDEEAEKWKTIKDIVDLLEKQGVRPA